MPPHGPHDEHVRAESRPTVSHHMRIMADEGLLVREQAGRAVWYWVVPDRLADVTDALRSDQDPVTAIVDPGLLDRIARDLTVRFRGVFSAETISQYVYESHALLGERARTTRYLSSLTAWFAADRLRSLADAEGQLTDDVVRAADYVITMGCGDACPIFPGKRYEDWELVEDCPAIRHGG